MANSQSQHRSVFVGNIPYDATEEQLVQICEEVGPVVSFRLVIDRETGKPKGYGFCEYKDEETALSARRNLQGYEINGRQLRVDFAENDKNTERNREQGRGGPGMVTNVDPQKQFGVPAVGDLSFHQPLGDSVAAAAAAVMAGALGGAQTTSTSNQIGLQSQPVLGTDPLTLHLAKMSRSQLTGIISEMKEMATQNKEQARQLLLASPNLSKALFQAQLMLGMVPPQMLQIPNIRQSSPQPAQFLLQSGQHAITQTPPGLPPLPQNKMHLNLSHAQENQISSSHPSQHPVLPQFPTQSQIQRPQLTLSQVLQQGQLPAQSGISVLPSVHPHELGNLSVRPHIQPTTSSALNQRVQTPMLQHPGPIPSTSSRYTGQMIAPNATFKPSSQTHLQFPAQGFQQPTSVLSGTQNNMDLKGHSVDQMNHSLNLSTSVPGATSNFVNSRKQDIISEGNSNSQKQAAEVPLEMESALIQQVLSLTPEQLSSLPPEQQQEVIQLQQMLRQAT